MTAKETKAGVEYSCDNDGCNATFTAPTASFRLAWPIAKAAGWCCAKAGGRFFHFCMWIHGEGQNALERRAAEMKNPAV